MLKPCGFLFEFLIVAHKEDKNTRTRASVFDRLLDYEPRLTTESPKSQSFSISELKQSVLRDLEWLLNTRQPIFANQEMQEAKNTVIFYGVPDFTGLGVRSEVEFKQFATNVETAIRRFEPRIFDVEITFEPVDNLDRQIRFRIEARLDADPTPEPITFDSVIHAGNGRVSMIAR